MTLAPGRWATPVSARRNADGSYTLAADNTEILQYSSNIPYGASRYTVGTGRLPMPERVAPYQITGTTYFYNSAASPGGNGLTAATAFKTLAAFGAVYVAGDGLLIKNGDTILPGGLVQFATTGTSGSKVVIGVYDPATSQRIFGGTALATIDVAGTATACVYMPSMSYFCFDGIKFKGGNGTGAVGQVTLDGSSANNQFLGCEASGGTGHGFLLNASGLGNVFEGCRARGNAGAGMSNVITATNMTTRFSYNDCSGNGADGIAVGDAGAGYRYIGTIAGNACDSNLTTADTGGIRVVTRGGAPQILGNTCTRNFIGIFLQRSSAGAQDWAGTYVDGNTCNNNAWFGIEWYEIRCLAGRGFNQYNTCNRNGSWDDINPATTEKYGRGVEFYGATAAAGCSGITNRWNVYDENYNFIDNASEGVGSGLDDNCADILSYGNVMRRNQGNAIQFNSNVGRCTATSNILDDNNLYTQSRGTFGDNGQAGIAFVLSPGTVIENNTVIGHGREFQKLGIGQNSVYASAGSIVRNNLLIGFTSAGMSINPAETTESNNIVEGTRAVVNCATGASMAMGSGTRLVALGTSGAVAPNYVPTTGGIADGTGAMPSPGALSLVGQSLIVRTPIGALHAL
jgi:hypothetical protein